MNSQPSVYVIDDEESVRLALSDLLASAGLTARTYSCAADFLLEAGSLSPGCVLADVRMPGMDGLEMIRRLREQNAPHAAIVVTGYADVPLAVEAMKAGASDFLEKPVQGEGLILAVLAALKNHEPSSPAGPAQAEAGQRFALLTAREREVLIAVVDGLSNKAIAQRLGISPRTVEVHRSHVMRKARAETLSELIRLALAAGVCNSAAGSDPTRH